MVVVKIMGLVDIMAAAIIYFTDFGGIWEKLSLLLVVVLIVKGLPSLLG